MQGLKTFLIIVIFVIVAGLGIYFAQMKIDKKNETAKETTTEDQGTVAGTQTSESTALDTSNAKDIGAIFFYGSTCPHCKKVEQFFSDQKVLEKIKVDQKEVYESQDNARLMGEYQDKCKDLSEDDKGGVPFLYTPAKCVVGDQPIIDFFTEQLKNL